MCMILGIYYFATFVLQMPIHHLTIIYIPRRVRSSLNSEKVSTLLHIMQQSNGIQRNDEEGLPSKELVCILFGFVIPLVGE